MLPDQLHYPNETIEAATTNMFGEENVNSSNYPYESVAAYYKRSSYNKLNISGDVFGWYKTKYNSSYYEQQGDRMVLIREVLEYYKSQGLDFEQYDNDNDGYLDGLYIRYANRTHSLGGFWWAYMYYGGSMDWYEIDGEKIYGYVWIPNKEAFTGNYSDLPNLYRPLNLQSQGGSTVRQYPTEGIVVYHIDATPNISSNFGFMYDNSYTTHKLVKIMEADGTNKIETLPYTTYSGYKCGSENFFASAKTFSDTTTPNSKKYDGNNTNMKLMFQPPTGTYARVDIAYSSTGQIPTALTAFYNNQTNKVHVKFDSAITSYTNYSNIKLKQKYSVSYIQDNFIIGENEIIITPTDELKDGRYIVNIPADAIKNSNNVGNSATELNIAIETYPTLLKRQLRLDAFKIYARDLNNTTLTDEFLNSNARSIYGYVEMYNNTSLPKQYSVYLIRRDNQRLAVLNISDLTINAYQSNYIYTNTLPVTDIEKNRFELLLWEKNSMQPITISRILE